MKKCLSCGKTLTGPWIREKTKYCNRACFAVAHKKWWDEHVSVKERFSRRMTRKNPLHDPKIKAQVGNTIRELGLKPKVRGGNGTGPTKAEYQLLRMFPEAVWNYAIKTGKWNGSGFPPVYKVDLAFPDLKLAIEADGACHNNWDNRKAKDQKKQKFLEGLGWTVLRYSNKVILDFRRNIQILADVQFTISKLKATQATA